jgi:hypothetical protein
VNFKFRKVIGIGFLLQFWLFLDFVFIGLFLLRFFGDINKVPEIGKAGFGEEEERLFSDGQQVAFDVVDVGTFDLNHGFEQLKSLLEVI